MKKAAGILIIGGAGLAAYWYLNGRQGQGGNASETPSLGDQILASYVQQNGGLSPTAQRNVEMFGYLRNLFSGGNKGATTGGGGGGFLGGLINKANTGTSAPTGGGGGTAIGQRLMGDLMRTYRLTRAQAAGVVGNLDHESAGFRQLQEMQPVVPGSRGGWGFAQWTGPRRRQMEAWAAQRNLSLSSYEANWGFLRHELSNTPEGRVLPRLRRATDVEQATRIFQDVFLRPGIPHTSSRIAKARRYL
jgi:hypothetical protein